MTSGSKPGLLILNQMAGPMTWELAEDAGRDLGRVALLTGHPDTLLKKSDRVMLFSAPIYHRGSLTRRAFSWIRYSLRSWCWLWRWPADIPVIIFSNPPILCWVGWAMKKIRRQRYSVIVHDIYPDVLVRMAGYSERNPLIRVWRWMNRKAYENAEVVITLDELMAANLQRQIDSKKTRSRKVEVVYPWVDTDRITPMLKEKNWFAKRYNQLGKLTVMYSGNMGLGHDIETMLTTAKALRTEPNIHFFFIGAGPKWNTVKEVIEREQLSNVTLLPWQSEDDLPYQLAAADIGLVTLESELWDLAFPSKAIYMMAAGCALLCLAPSVSTLASVNKKTSSGITISIGDSASLFNHIKTLLDNKQHLRDKQYRARNAAVSIYSREKNVGKFLSLIINKK